MSDTPPVDLRVELFHSGAWHDISDDVLGQRAVDIRDGATSPGSGVDAGRVTLELRGGESEVAPGVVGRYNPDNPDSDLFGLIGHATPLRVVAHGVVLAQVELSAVIHTSDVSGEDVRAPTTGRGIMQRRGRHGVVTSAVRQFYESLPPELLVAYLPLEDAGEGRVAAPGTDNNRPQTYARSAPPEFGRGPTPSGSSPLPLWPLVQSPFGWATGSRLLVPAEPPWARQVLCMVPPGSGELRLDEWATNGDLDMWRLEVTAAGQVRVVAESSDEDGPSGLTVTATSPVVPIDDGQWHVVMVAASQNPSEPFFVSVRADLGLTTSGDHSSSLGAVTTFRTRPSFTSTSGKEPIGLGHATVLRGLPRRHLNSLMPPIHGGDGEAAVARAMRLAGESGVQITVAGREQVAGDDFDREESGGWGTSSSGHDWVPTPSSDPDAFSVTGVRGQVVSTDDLQEHAIALDGLELSDVDVACTIRRQGSGRARLLWRMRDEQNFYSAGVRTAILDDESRTVLELHRAVDVPHDTTTAAVLLAEVEVLGGLLTSPVRVRVVAIGQTIMVRAWHPPDAEPVTWHIVVNDPDPRLRSGTIGIRARVVDSPAPVAQVWDLVVDRPPRSASLGPQQPTSALGNLRQAGEADHGMVVEEATHGGYRYVGRTAMSNQDPKVLLRWARDILLPLRTERDDRTLANQVTVRRIGGASARATREVGPKSTAEPPAGVGPGYTAELALNVHSDDTLRDHAGLALLDRAWPEPRLAPVTLDLRAIAEDLGDVELRDALLAVVPGDRVDITDVPEWLAVGDLRLLVRGREVSATGHRLRLTLHTTPYGPHVVGEFAEEPGPADPVRYAPTDSRVDALFDAGVDTALSVVDGTGGNDLWAEDAATPFDVLLRPANRSTGVVLRVTAVGAATGAVQVLTVEQAPVNGVERVAPAGWVVELSASGRYGL